MTFEIALTGLNSSSKKLGVVANNIANANTVGFKQSRAEFQDIYAISNMGPGKTQAGSGVQVSNVRQLFTQGNVDFTESNLDLAIGGQGYFRMSDAGSIVYTRAGMFGMNRDGMIVNADGLNLTGYGIDDNGAVIPALQNLKIDLANLPAKASSEVTMGLNLDAGVGAPVVAFDPANANSFNFSTSVTFYDSQGTSHIANMYFIKQAAPVNSWESLTYVNGAQRNAGGAGPNGGDVLTFDLNGVLTDINGAPGGTGTTALFQPTPATAPLTLALNYGQTTQFTGEFGVNKLTVDGFSSGRLTDVSVESNGMIFGRYTNGQSRVMGQVVLSNFANQEGLRPVGNSNWVESFDSGSPATGTPGSASLGMLQASALEQSNVDITKELVDMIAAQRSFQANAQVVSVADQLTQAVINIRR
ncbi:MAG: flagellar hook protein FlgE [Thiotrichales bacterium]